MGKYEKIIKLIALKEQSDDKEFVQELINQEEDRLENEVKGMMRLFFNNAFKNTFDAYKSKPRYDEENIEVLKYYKNLSFANFAEEIKDELDNGWNDTDKTSRNATTELMYQMFKEKVEKDYQYALKYYAEEDDLEDTIESMEE